MMSRVLGLSMKLSFLQSLWHCWKIVDGTKSVGVQEPTQYSVHQVDAHLWNNLVSTPVKLATMVTYGVELLKQTSVVPLTYTKQTATQ